MDWHCSDLLMLPIFCTILNSIIACKLFLQPLWNMSTRRLTLTALWLAWCIGKAFSTHVLHLNHGPIPSKSPLATMLTAACFLSWQWKPRLHKCPEQSWLVVPGTSFYSILEGDRSCWFALKRRICWRKSPDPVLFYLLLHYIGYHLFHGC